MAAMTVAAVVSLLVCLFSSAVDSYELGMINSVCDRVPFPDQCRFFLGQSPSNNNFFLQNNALMVLLQLAQTQALQGVTYVNSLGPRCRDQREKAAWSDCVELYQETQRKLISINIFSGSGSVDSQTWLSAALTNLDTCKNGFQDFGVTGNVFSLLSNNASYMISNTLALGKPQPRQAKYVDGFPDWVKPGDRKLLQSSSVTPNVVVAQDGTGNYKTVGAAVDAAPGGSRFVIYVKAGTYDENVEVTAKNVMLIGDGIGKTIITGSRSVGGGYTTFKSATVAVKGDNFIGRGITFRNTAGPQNHQAVALRSGSDLSVFYQCGFEGYQDTLYSHSQRQFYKNCDIYGTVDYIFGNSAVVIQDCNIYSRNPPNKINTITAHGRTDPNQNTGISIQNCNVTADVGLSSAAKTYLGRPWKEYSRTVFMQSYLDSLINPAGWYPWSGNFALDTLYYGEYSNTGPGSSTANRVKWKGYNVITSPSVASQFTVSNLIAGDAWLPATGVPFKAGL